MSLSFDTALRRGLNNIFVCVIKSSSSPADRTLYEVSMKKSVLVKRLGLVIFMFHLTACGNTENSSESPLFKDDFHKHTHDEVQVCEGFLPKNDLKISSESKNILGISESQFQSVLLSVEKIYSPIVKSMGATLEINRLWSSEEVNAFASRKQNIWRVDMHGGLARHSAITTDGLALITCHEVGHHLGGSPRYNRDWASVEGQSDYFATLKCLRKVFEAEMPEWNGSVDRVAQEKCDAAFGSRTLNSKLCGRIAMAGKSAASLSQALGGGAAPRFDIKDPSVVSSTMESHPKTQCRMDTYFNGSLCRTSHTNDVGATDPLKGVCKNTVAEEYGARARCWYKPTTGVPPINDPVIPPLDPTDPPPTDPPPTDPPPTDPPPVDDAIAKTPLLNGVNVLKITNPNTIINLQYDVSNFANARGLYFEIIGPNLDFSDPNGTQPDPRAMPGGSLPKLKGSITIKPSRHLPGWGVYKMRLIALDATGRKAVSQFSNAAILRLEPQ